MYLRWMHRNCQDWLRYMHITYRTESENMNIVYSTCRLTYPPVCGDLDRCIFGPGALVKAFVKMNA